MQRVRRAVNAALVLVVALCLSSGPAATLFTPATVRAAAVAWPPSTLVLSEIQTGGGSASDEFVEIANQGSSPVDLVGLELVYSTASGSTVTRKASWSSSLVLGPGQRLLIANAVGGYAASGDGTYSGGFAATGGALAMRVIGGSVIDAIGWGEATNPFVEGTPAPAPAPASTLERSPGGALGNGIDTNENALDWFVSATPSPQNLASPPVPEPGMPPPSPTATVAPTVEPTPDPTAEPTPDPTSTPTLAPTPDPTLEPTPDPTPEPSAAPTPVAIASARALVDGSVATVAGVLTTDLGALEGGRTAFLEDGSAGIALYLDAPVIAAIAAGTAVELRGTVDDRFAQRTLRVAEDDVVAVGSSPIPVAALIPTGSATEPVEGRRIRAFGPITSGPDALADGTAVTIDDGSGPLRIVITPTALGGLTVAIGDLLDATGPLGQRDSSGTGREGYRLYVTAPSDLTIAPPPPPSPTTSPTPPQPSPSAAPSPTAAPPSAAPTPSSSPTPPSGETIASVRALPAGSAATVRGVVTAEIGRLGSPNLFVIGDATGGLPVKLPSGATPPTRGRSVVVSGSLADPYGQLEIRPTSAGIVVGGSAPLPAPVDLPPSGPSEATEGRLVRVSGVLVGRPRTSSAGDVTLVVETANGTRLRVMADASSRLLARTFATGARYRLVGVAGQRASTRGVPDGYRIWLRDRRDVTLLGPAPSGGPSSTPRPGASPSAPPVVRIAAALRATGRTVAIQAIVTAPATLLDGSGRRIVVQDGSGAIEILLPKDGPAPRLGSRVRAIGKVGSAYGAPRLRASAVDRLGSSAVPGPLRIIGPVSTAHAWRLVRVAGRVESVRKLGERWRAELSVGSHRIVVLAQPGARIPDTALLEGRAAVVIGIVRLANPSATDRRPSVLPRWAADIRLGGSGPIGRGTGTPVPSGAPGGETTTPSPSDAGAGRPADLADLASSIDSTVRVGGLVVEVTSDGFLLDDGTATTAIVLAGRASAWRDLVEPDDAINVTGVVAMGNDGEPVVIVDDPAAISLGSALDGVAGSSTAASSDPSGPPASADLRIAGLGDMTDGLPGVSAGIAGLTLIALASIAVTVVRRRHARDLVAARVALRLASIRRVRTDAGPPTREAPSD